MFVFADCGWSGTAFAWIDTNEDGVWDATEVPLPGVQFQINDTLNAFTDVGSDAVSDWKGYAYPTVFLPGCPDAEFEIIARSPPNYRTTTPAQMVAPSNGTFRFGYTYIEGAPTVTPRLPSMACAPLTISAYAEQPRVVDMAVAPNGDIWFATVDSGVVRYDQQRQQWVVYRTVHGLASDRVYRIYITPHGDVWVAASSGVSHWNGRRWQSYGEADGLAAPNVRSIAMAADGVLWFATANGLSTYDPASGNWQRYTMADGLPDNSISTVATTPDGSIWISVDYPSVLLRYTGPPGADATATTSFTTYRGSIERIGAIDFMQGMADNTLWVADGKYLARIDLEQSKWQLYEVGDVQSVEMVSDQVAWVEVGRRVIQLNLRGTTSEQQILRILDATDGIFTEDMSDMIIAPDGAVLIASAQGVSRCIERIP